MTVRPFLSLATLALCASALVAQERDTTRVTGATLTGVVYDSVSRAPLGGATVQVIATDSGRAWTRSALADGEGRYRIEGIPNGRYTIGFLHAMLDSLGLEPPLRGLVVRGEQDVRADLTIPGPARIAYTVCGPRHSAGGALVMGIVRDAETGAPVSGAEVIGEWIEFTFTKEGVVTNVPKLADTSRANGWFALCDVPSPGRIALAGTHDARTSDRIEVELSSAGFLRRDLFLGAERDSATRRMSGTVVAVAGGRPLADALVSVGGSVQVRTNERGEWSLNAAPGTRVLEVHAIGYYPERVTVDVVEGMAPRRVALFTMRAMLDTIKVVAKRTTPAMRGFEERRRTGMGRYLDAAYIERRHAMWTSELFHMVPGVYVTGGTVGTGDEGGVKLRDPVSMGYCAPAFFLDGAYVDTLTSLTLDAFVSPEDIAGIEIYRAPLIPAQFMTGGRTVMECGAIAVWTAPAMTRSRLSFKRRALIAGALMGTGYILNGVIRHLFNR